MKHFAIALFVVVTACSSKKEAPAPAASGSAPATGSGSATASGSGSAAATGSATATGSGSGSGSDSGSGSAVTAGSGSGSAGTGSGSGSDTAVAASDFDFDKLTHDQKIDFMKKKVMPAMKKAFQDFDKKKYASFTCKTCHGKDPVKSKYKMPNPALAKLDFEALKAGKQKPKAAEFMGKVVKPQMAKLLNQPEYSESNPKGFGCLECHEQKK